MLDDLFVDPIITRTATQAELDELAEIVGPLPPSYSVFAKRYGYGRVNGLLFISMPFRDVDDLFEDYNNGMANITASCVDTWTEWGNVPGDPDCLEAYDDRSKGVAVRWREFVFFASSENGEYFFWLETEGSFSFFTVDGEGLSIRHGGDDLVTMIGDMQTPRVKHILGTGYEPLPPIFGGDENFTQYLSR